MFRFLKRCKFNSRSYESFCDNLIRCTGIYREILPYSNFCSNRLPTNNAVLYKSYAKYSTSSITISEMDTGEPLSEPNIAQITEGDAELEHKLRVLILEVDVMRQEGKAVPSSMKTDSWKELLKLPSKSARKRYLEFLFKTEKKRENRMKKKEQKRLEWEQNPKPKENIDEVQTYGLGHNSFFLRIYDSTINQMYNHRLIQAMQFGQKLVVDCGYHENMTNRENLNCAKQLMLSFAENRFSDEPFDLHYCNANFDGNLLKGLHKFIATMYEPWFPLNLHEQSYLDIFPKEKLVYLTPHCKEVMTKYDHDAIYIIGGIVDKVNNDPLSLAKAKKEGLRMAKLPLDNYLSWGSGSGKSLTVNQVTSILLDVKNTGDWKYALRHVPRRKLLDNTVETTVRTFNNRVNNMKNLKSSSWRPNARSTDLDNLHFGRRKFNGANEETSKSTRLVDVKKVIN